MSEGRDRHHWKNKSVPGHGGVSERWKLEEDTLQRILRLAAHAGADLGILGGGGGSEPEFFKGGGVLGSRSTGSLGGGVKPSNPPPPRSATAMGWPGCKFVKLAV